MKIGIIGVGPIGGILAAHLAKNGEDVVAVDILKDHLDEMKKNGLRISGYVDMNVKIENVCYSIPELAAFDVDVIFISVKASILENILPQIKKISTPKMKIISFQNGLDTEELIAKYFGAENTLRGVINYAGNFVANGYISMSFFNKPNYIGVISPKNTEFAKQIAQIMSSAALDTEFTTNIKKHVWEKTILNSALSPVCALTKMTMKEAMDFEETYTLVEEILREGIEVAKTAGYDYGPDFLEHCISYLKKAGLHKPSMLIDIEAKRTTEIDFLNNRIAFYGLRYNILTPYNSTITYLIKALELQNRKK